MSNQAMTNDKKAEQWRKEFESIHGSQARFPNGEYCYPVDQYYWQGFLMAKRNQPAIELPETDHYYLDDDVYDAEEVHEAITAAGYSYKVNPQV